MNVQISRHKSKLIDLQVFDLYRIESKIVQFCFDNCHICVPTHSCLSSSCVAANIGSILFDSYRLAHTLYKNAHQISFWLTSVYAALRPQNTCRETISFPFLVSHNTLFLVYSSLFSLLFAFCRCFMADAGRKKTDAATSIFH